MPPKRSRAADSFLSLERTQKIPKLKNEKTSHVKIGLKAIISQIQELERALDQNDNHSRILYLAREIAKTPDLPPQLTTRLLKFCIHVGSEFVMRQVLDSQSINLKTREGSELLWTAIEEGQEEIIMLLVHFGVDLSIRLPRDSRSVLHEVLRSHKIKNNTKREEIVKLMLDYGADVNACDNSGYSVLHDAIKHNHCSRRLVEELLERGANVTICEEFYLDDLISAFEKKSEMFLKLLEHQVPDEATRNRRGVIAIEHLFTMQYTGTQLADAMEMIKKILDLGVSLDTPDPFPENRRGRGPSPLLHEALWLKKKDAVKILLDYGADPLQKNGAGETPLYLATAYKSDTHASRWLLERGASIHDRNSDGRYPIHGACAYESLSNIHLLLNLGADLNCTDNKGCTPFRYTSNTHNFTDAHYLIMKHLALIIAKGGKICGEDVKKIEQYQWSKIIFKNYTKQLERMKIEKVHGDVTYFSMFSSNMFTTMQMVKNSNFAKNFKNAKRRADLFPEYFYMLLHAFEVAENRYKILLEEKKEIQKTFGKAVPDCVIEKITYYLCYERLERCQYDYYMTLHEELKDTKIDKAKIQ